MGRKKIIDEETLLANARAVFLEHGAAGTTKDIASRAGISEAAIFARYSTKTALFLAALMPPEVEVRSLIASDIEDPKAALVETGHRLLGHFRKIVPLALRLMENPAIDMADLGGQFGSARINGIAQQLADFLTQKDNDGVISVKNPMAASHLLIAAIHSVALYELMKLHGSDNLEHSVELFVDALCAGLPPGAAGLLEP